MPRAARWRHQVDAPQSGVSLVAILHFSNELAAPSVRAEHAKQPLKASFYFRRGRAIDVFRHPRVQFLFGFVYTWTCVLTVQRPFARFVTRY
jgi:hypothetical protein